MEESRESSGVAKAGLTTGIIGTALGLLRNDGGHNLLGGLLGGNGCGHHGLGLEYVISNERRLACLEAREAAIEMAERKNERIAHLEDVITRLEGKAYTDAKTCHKLDAELHYSPHQIADPYKGNVYQIATYPAAPVPPVPQSRPIWW